MSKELEYLADLYSHTKCDYDDLDCKNIVQTSYNKLKKALTPPTTEEVCEALSEALSGEVTFYNDEFFLQDQYDDFEDLQITYYSQKHLKIEIDFSLPLHIITLIGRFYEGLENE